MKVPSKISWLTRRVGSGLPRWWAESLVPEITALVCILTLLWSIVGVSLYRTYDAAEATALQITGNLARAFEESTRREISQIDQILLSVRQFYLAQGDRFRFADWARNQTLPDPMTAAIGLADQNGQVFADTIPFKPGVSIADRPHFIVQKDAARDNLYISVPVHGRVSNRDTIQFTRKLVGPTGEFAGVAVFSLDCEELSRFYQTLDLGGGFVSLIASDGTILARGPFAANAIGQPLSLTGPLGAANGTVQFVDSPTGTTFLASFRHLRDYPLIVMVGLDSATVFHDYRLFRIRVGIAGISVSLAIGCIGMLWVQQKRHSIAAAAALKITLETISQGIIMVDAAGQVPVVNSRALSLLSVPDGDARAMREAAADQAMHLATEEPTELPQTDRRFDATRDSGRILEVSCHSLSGGGIVQTFTDVTEQRLIESQVRYLAHHDTLTGLPNRTQLRCRIPEFIEQSRDPDHRTAFIMIDLDGFKSVNDSLGHDVGDELLIEIARRLRSIVRESDFVARLGGDEFIILQTGLRHTGQATALAARLLRELAEPAQIGDHQISIGASTGIAFCPRDGIDADMLLKHADIALYVAKSEGRGIFRRFEPQMIHAVAERRTLETGLRRALEGDELELHFQPKFACDTLQIMGMEALVRWHSPQRGYVSPETFVRIAEDCGLINRLGNWVLETACAAAANWQPRLPVAVNVSVLQLHNRKLPDEVAALLRRHGLPPEMLEVEVTESIMAEHNQPVLETLTALKAMGIGVTLDDFGTGYSSLSYLRRFPFDKVKIDKSFVQGQASDRGVRIILETLLSLCQRLDLPVVGEGVETQQQLEVLRRCGCTEAQGYLLARPMRNDQLEVFLRQVPAAVTPSSEVIDSPATPHRHAGRRPGIHVSQSCSKKGVDADLRRHDEQGGTDGSIITRPGITPRPLAGESLSRT
jgi:diguanylate cyclase (GGDEF)-like protein